MLRKTVLYCLLYTVLSVSSECEQGCQKFRVKRGKYYSNPPSRFYNQPPMVSPVQGPFSYTPPPFINDKPSYPGRRPYKVSKIPKPFNSDGLGDDDIANIVKYMSSQDLEKLLEFAQNKDQGYNKYKDRYNTNEYTRPFKRENRENEKYERPPSYKEETEFLNYVTEPTFESFLKAEENHYPKSFRDGTKSSLTREQTFTNPDPPPSFSFLNKKQHTENQPTYFNIVAAQELDTTKENSNKPVSYPVSKNPIFIETNEEEKLPLPVNMREEDHEVSFTNNVPKIVKANSYEVQNFGDLPLMDYNSKLHDVSSYHVPHYTVTNPSQKGASAQSSSASSSPLLKTSPASAHILQPIYETAPPVSAAAGQSDAHLKATKIWSYKSRGAAYTLHDDGTLTPERSTTQ